MLTNYVHLLFLKLLGSDGTFFSDESILAEVQVLKICLPLFLEAHVEQGFLSNYLLR
jgi:hypothetical protein